MSTTADEGLTRLRAAHRRHRGATGTATAAAAECIGWQHQLDGTQHLALLCGDVSGDPAPALSAQGGR